VLFLAITPPGRLFRADRPRLTVCCIRFVLDLVFKSANRLSHAFAQPRQPVGAKNEDQDEGNDSELAQPDRTEEREEPKSHESTFLSRLFRRGFTGGATVASGYHAIFQQCDKPGVSPECVEVRVEAGSRPAERGQRFDRLAKISKGPVVVATEGAESGHVVFREWVVGPLGQAAFERAQCAVEVFLRVVGPTHPEVGGAEFVVHIDQTALLERVARGHELSDLLGEHVNRGLVITPQIVNVAESGIRPDYLQPLSAGHKTLLHLDRAPARRLGPVVLATDGVEQPELQMGVSEVRD